MADIDFEAELRKLFQKIRTLRRLQREYFANRTPDRLELAKNAERDLDAELRRLDGLLGDQKTLW